MITNLNTLADRLKGVQLNGEEITPEKLIEIHSDENEVEVTFTEGVYMTNDELDGFKERIGKDSAKSGAKTIMEMEIKKHRNDLGLEFEGKTIDNLITAVREKAIIDTKKPVDEKVKELQGSLVTLQSKYEVDIENKNSTITSLTGQIQEGKTSSTLMQSIPKNLKGIKPNQAVALFKMEHELAYEDESLVVKKQGKVLKDSVEKPLAYNEVFNDFLKANNWVSVDGRGNGDNSGGSSSEFKTIEDVFKYMEKNSIDPTDNQGQILIDKFNSSQD